MDESPTLSETAADPDEGAAHVHNPALPAHGNDDDGAGPTDPAPSDTSTENQEARADDDADEMGPSASPHSQNDPPDLIGERPCPTCDGAGFLPYGVLQSPRYTTCDECGGIGQVLTGSLVSETAVTVCEKCNGAGFMATPTAPPSLVPQIGGSAPQTSPPWPGAIWDAQNGAWISAASSTA